MKPEGLREASEKLSSAALSQILPERLIEQVTPLSAISFWNCSLAYWTDSTVRRNALPPTRHEQKIPDHARAPPG